MSAPSTTSEQFEIVNGDAPLSDRAIVAIADLLIAIDDAAHDHNSNEGDAK